MSGWILGGGPQNNIILSSRIRLARNISNIPFPAALDVQSSDKISAMVEEVFKKGKKVSAKYKRINISELNTLDKQVLVERHVVSPNLVRQGSNGAAIVSDDEVVSIMINEEDHIRLQTIMPGFQIKKAWELSSAIDDMMEKKLEYAFDEKWGYLTCCPTNVGTGMRASVMVHLPALVITGNINKILQAANQIGLTSRGLYGEGTEAVGDIFQISNQITLGRSEEEIVENLAAVTSQIIGKEYEARRILMENNRLQIEDRIWRSLGILKNARIMQSQECMRLLSDIRLGVDLKIIDDIPVSVLNGIMIDAQPASLQKSFQSEMGPGERDYYRAEMIRKRLEEYKKEQV